MLRGAGRVSPPADPSSSLTSTVPTVPDSPRFVPPAEPSQRGALARQRRLGRHDLLRALLLLPLLVPWVAMLQRQQQRRKPAAFALPAELPLGLSVAGPVVAHRADDGTVRVWSSRCTHLGCRLDRVVEGVLVCPCHGSRFDADGQVLTGPASRALQPLRVVVDPDGVGWQVDLS